MPKILPTLRAIRVKDIDLDEAQRHFDLPIEDQFSNRRDLISGLTSTRDSLIAMFKVTDTISIWRGMDCDKDWAASVEPGDDLGQSWAWQESGAIKGSGLDGYQAQGVLLFATVEEHDVDWELTIAVNTFHEDECEIVLRPDADVSLQTIHHWPSRELLVDWTDRHAGPSL